MPLCQSVSAVLNKGLGGLDQSGDSISACVERVRDAKQFNTRLEDVRRPGKLSKRLYFNNAVGLMHKCFSLAVVLCVSFNQMSHCYWGF